MCVVAWGSCPPLPVLYLEDVFLLLSMKYAFHIYVHLLWIDGNAESSKHSFCFLELFFITPFKQHQLS
jgi:hypothetical protein